MRERERIKAIGDSLQTLRMPGGDIIVSVGAHGPSVDCPQGFMSVTAQRGDDTYTYEAVHLQDAILGAHGRLNELIRLRLEKTKANAKKSENPQ